MNGSPRAVDAALAAELAELRRLAGFSKNALAKRIGILPDEVDRSEAGQRGVDVVELFFWCNACGSSLDLFMERLNLRLTIGVCATRH